MMVVGAKPHSRVTAIVLRVPLEFILKIGIGCAQGDVASSSARDSNASAALNSPELRRASASR